MVEHYTFPATMVNYIIPNSSTTQLAMTVVQSTGTEITVQFTTLPVKITTVQVQVFLEVPLQQKVEQ